MAITEGKLPLTFEVYTFLAKSAFKTTSDFSQNRFIHDHLYLLLCLNLIARSNSVASFRFTHIGWDRDSLTITLPKRDIY